MRLISGGGNSEPLQPVNIQGHGTPCSHAPLDAFIGMLRRFTQQGDILEVVVHPLVESSPFNPPQTDRDRSATQTPSLIAASFRT